VTWVTGHAWTALPVTFEEATNMTVLDTVKDYRLSAGASDLLSSGVIGHVLDGEVTPSASGKKFPVYDPSTGQQIAEAADGGQEEVERAVGAARASFEDGRWRGLRPQERERRLRRLAELLEANRDVLGDLDALDAGILHGYAGFIVDFAVGGVNYYAGWPTKLKGSSPDVSDDVDVRVLREPIGVVAIIVPWNGPTAVIAFVAAALAAGNSVVLKPAPQTPLSAHLLGRLCLEAGIPDGVVNVLQGTGAAGAALVNHPQVDKISFTGSVRTGKAIATAAASQLKKVTLELGGKSPFIVFGDADLELAVAGATNAVWNNSGQVCTAGTRTLVHRSIYDDFVAAAVEASKGLRLGSAFDEQTQMGPLISAEQLTAVEEYVGIGVAEGAELVLGGSRGPGSGYLHEPTIFTGVRNDMRIAQEEIFGPVMSLMPFDDEAEAYALANDVEFGLAAGVFTHDLDRAHRATRALHVGTVWINSYQLADAGVPYGGVKQSGYGRVLGEDGLNDFMQTKSVWTKFATQG
jgi:acyl-CoA reductase-like NAD-dependent aldehyde dehydrogenase